MPAETTETHSLIPLEAHLEGLHRLHRGKVRDLFPLGDHTLLIVATDRVSAFDAVLPQRIPDKGKVLTSLSTFWFERVADFVPHHVLETDISKMPMVVRQHADLLAGRSMLVHRATPVKAEFVVRGYLAGSGWKDYKRTGEICGHRLPEGLQQCDRLPEPILTPSTKAPAGQHDEPLTVPQLAHQVGTQIASHAGALALDLYQYAASWAAERGILLADTKLEFGIFEGRLMLIDELFTPDSSRYWLADDYEPGRPQESYDKQVIRDALDAMGWDRSPPAPDLPDELVQQARERYLDIHRRITDRDLA